jgi:E3 ubiquitin-protein ligase FANCL
MHVYISRDESLDVVSNLEAVLGVRLPGPLRGGDGAEEEEEEGDTSCAICYSTEDPEAGTSSSHGVKSGPLCSYPDQICPNAKCCRRYHRGCLTSWMQSLPTSRMAFGTLFGACPYCSENMSINLMKT